MWARISRPSTKRGPGRLKKACPLTAKTFPALTAGRSCQPSSLFQNCGFVRSSLNVEAAGHQDNYVGRELHNFVSNAIFAEGSPFRPRTSWPPANSIISGTQ